MLYITTVGEFVEFFKLMKKRKVSNNLNEYVNFQIENREIDIDEDIKDDCLSWMLQNYEKNENEWSNFRFPKFVKSSN
jgi:hypothetical protein